MIGRRKSSYYIAYSSIPRWMAMSTTCQPARPFVPGPLPVRRCRATWVIAYSPDFNEQWSCPGSVGRESASLQLRTTCCSDWLNKLDLATSW